VLTLSANSGTLGERQGAVEPRVDGGGAPAAQETLRPRVADGKLELTEAKDGARARRRSQNGR
jgi:hypothetical protein